MLDINKVENFNNSFVGFSSQKPICGHFLNDMFKHNISQAKVNTQEVIYPGIPVQIKNYDSSQLNNLNVLNITKKAENANELDAFILSSPTDVVLFGNQVALPLYTQIINVALIGSGVELYLPADASLADVSVSSKLLWDFTTQTLKVLDLGYITLLSPIVDGIRYIEKDGKVIYENTKCVKVRI